MDEKLKMLSNIKSRAELEAIIDDPAQFEAKLGLPVTKSETAIVPYYKKIHEDWVVVQEKTKKAKQLAIKMKNDNNEWAKVREEHIKWRNDKIMKEV